MRNEFDRFTDECFLPTGPELSEQVKQLLQTKPSNGLIIFCSNPINDRLFHHLRQLFEKEASNSDWIYSLTKVDNMENNHFTAENVNKAEADIMQGGIRHGQLHVLVAHGDIFDLDKFDDPDPIQPETNETIKPVKKIPYYHHRRRF